MINENYDEVYLSLQFYRKLVEFAACRKFSHVQLVSYDVLCRSRYVLKMVVTINLK